MRRRVAKQSCPFSFNEDTLLPYDILLKEKEKELLCFNIDAVLRNNLLSRKSLDEIDGSLEDYACNFEGYRIADTHFKIGNKVHSEDFYYAKRLFQNSFFTTRLAMLLARKIDEVYTNDKTKSITLVGYEMYSELLLSLVEQFLIEAFKYTDICRFVAQNKENKLEFLPDDTSQECIEKYKERITITIVPIAATGSTTRKIEKEIREHIRKHIKEIVGEDKAKEESEAYFVNCCYNVLLAQDPGSEKDSFSDIKYSSDGKYSEAESIIELPATWHRIENCPLCFCYTEYRGDKVRTVTKPLFDTDSSSLTPSLIFENPNGKTKVKEKKDKWREIENNVVKFNDLDFSGSLKYQSEVRNGNHRIYSIDTNKFIRDNKGNIVKWLKEVVEPNLKNEIDKHNDTIIILAPCHESNSYFLNLINKHVFSSTATIIHHQRGVDFPENFGLLNENYLTNENTKIVFVDDSLITGSHFFELFDLARETKQDYPFTASILLNDQAVPFIHERAVRWSENYFAFTAINLPPTLSVLDKHPLEHERKRYERLQENVLHDTLRERFFEKTKSLTPEKRNEKQVSGTKQIRRLKMFEATHKIYDYFVKNEKVPNLAELAKQKSLHEFVNFKRHNIENVDEEDLNEKNLLKVLTQYPFILYKDLKDETFEWYKQELIELIKTKVPTILDISEGARSYDEFLTFIFLFRRAAFLDNYQILEKDFLKKLSGWFAKIEKCIEKQENGDFKNKIEDIKEEIKGLNKQIKDKRDIKPETKKPKTIFEQEIPKDKIESEIESLIVLRKSKEEEKSRLEKLEKIHNFPIFVLGNYVEMIQKNSWVAYRILGNLKSLQTDFEKSAQGRQFFNMLQIEATIVIDDLMKMINKEYRLGWRDMYKDIARDELYADTDRIVAFFIDERRKELLASNRYEVVKKIFDVEISPNTAFVNFLWTKQLLDADNDKDSYLQVGYQKAIDAIVEKMKGFFLTNVEAFFIVTDGQKKPHILSPQRGSIIDGFKDDFDRNGTQETRTLVDFLNGVPIGNARETTAEFVRQETKKWKNIYTKKSVSLDFMPSDKYKWLYLIRISKLDDQSEKCEFAPQGLLGFYSKEDLSDHIFPKQLLMLLRHDMSKFIDKHHKNNTFAELMIGHNIRKFYENNFAKFSHSAGKFIRNYRNLSLNKQNDSDCNKMLFSLREVIFENTSFGKYYADYLKALSEQRKWKPVDRGRVACYESTKISEIRDIVLGIDLLYSNEIYDNINISMTGFENIQTRLGYMYLKGIIIELICNVIKGPPAGTNRFVKIDCYTDRIICTSRNGKVDDVKIDTLITSIRGSRPTKEGIGLFIIEKIIFSTFDKHIELDFDSKTKIFKVTIPLN